MWRVQTANAEEAQRKELKTAFCLSEAALVWLRRTGITRMS
jgi:hypothetical protein